jgi:hypothetical protein
MQLASLPLRNVSTLEISIGKHVPNKIKLNRNNNYYNNNDKNNNNFINNNNFNNNNYHN